MDTGLKVYRNPFPIKFGTQLDCKYGVLYPVFRKIMYPGDVFKIDADLLIRYQPMMAPPMNDCIATVRFAFAPLRLLEQNTELIVTGSNDGHLSEETLPVMDSVFKYLETGEGKAVNDKHSILDYICGIPKITTDLSSALVTKLEASKGSPAAYFPKAYYRFWWDFYRDENLYTSYSDFDSFWNDMKTKLNRADDSLMSVALKKDRLSSALPWQLKSSVIPRVPITGTGSMSGFSFNYSEAEQIGTSNYAANEIFRNYPVYDNMTKLGAAGVNTGDPEAMFFVDPDSTLSTNKNIINRASAKFAKGIEDNLTAEGITFESGGFTGADVRDVMAVTRIYERLARCGSRYTEYLYANFGVAPRDDTLQRAQYLGGFKTRIVTTEVIQTAGDGDNPVGTLRGHGITHGTSTIKPYMAKEIGVIIGVLDIKPETIYAQGVDRELTARSRFDFFNPSFQHLSEQEVRKSEIYFDVDTDSDGNLKNNETWGFQPYAQELRTGIKHVVGDMRDSLDYWNQSLKFASRPSLNNAFITATSHLASYNRPFNFVDDSAYPMVVDFGGVIHAYRPLVRDGTPGLADHN